MAKLAQHEVMIEKMEKTLHFLKEDLNTLRAGRANPAILDKVVVDYYGSPTPLKNLSNISVPDPRTLMITPFDPKSIADVEKAINVANIGINPSNDGKVIRLAIPQVTEERRKELTKEEIDEREVLRKEYLAAFRANFKKQLDNIEIVDDPKADS